jgi:hypothetical protein
MVPIFINLQYIAVVIQSSVDQNSIYEEIKKKKKKEKKQNQQTHHSSGQQI